jgi:hypothetical protein
MPTMGFKKIKMSLGAHVVFSILTIITKLLSFFYNQWKNIAADYSLVNKVYVSYLKITLRINFRIKIECVKLLF